MNSEQLVLCDHDQKNMKIFGDAGMNVTINCPECRLIYKITYPAIRFGFEKGVTKEDKKKIFRLYKTVSVQKAPVVDYDLCIGCGICDNKCPVVDQPAITVTSVGEQRSETNRLLLDLLDPEQGPY